MKRCPACKFIYLDTDEVCDFDGTLLIVVDDKEFEASTQTEILPTAVLQVSAGRSRRFLTLAGLSGLAMGTLLLFAYFVAAKRSEQPIPSDQQIAQLEVPQTTAPAPLTPTPLPTAQPSPSAPERNNESAVPTPTRTSVSSNPVSTSNPAGVHTRVSIRLSTGARIEADEAWRTKEGVWYRRNGLVTLLKTGLVRAIEKSNGK